MYAIRIHSFRLIVSFLVLGALAAARAEAQAPTPQSETTSATTTQEQHQHQPPTQTPTDHAQHEPGAMAIFPSREASGTAWSPNESPMYGIHRPIGSWQVMGHGAVFVQFLYDGGARGEDQFGSINWLMGMAYCNVADGRLGFRGMISFEPWTVPGCGYPDLLATGERCNGEPIHDRQHQHDLFMELAAQYDRPLPGSIRWQVYGGPVGEPALGPVAYPHRTSAMPNPLAPIAHHWLDATHPYRVSG